MRINNIHLVLVFAAERSIPRNLQKYLPG